VEFPAEQIEALKRLFPNLSSATEGGVTFFLMDKVVLPEGCSPREVSALLCPTAREGYPSRLFISAQVEHPKKANWNPAGGSVILGRQWWALSWKVKEGQPLVQLVLDHLGGFRK
jgi:hypothetical protein